jgi:spermidine synthase
VAIGDAFGGIAVPWHLATLEFTEELHRTLRPDGVYVMNVIDYGDREFLRAEIATVGAVFDHVAVVGRGGSFGPTTPAAGGNYVVVASDAPLPLEQIEVNVRRGGTGHELLSGGELVAFVADARVLTDDFAPVDQLLQPRPGG